MAAVALSACVTSASPSSSDGPGGKSDDPEDSADRAARVVAAIEAWNQELSPEDRAAKYCKMAASPFGFFRGTDHLFWSDFAADPRLERYGDPSTRVWLQGDMHPQNFGTYLDDEGRLVYGLNDFDASLVADYQYDLWRMAVGTILSAEIDAGLDRDDAEDAVDSLVEAYLDAMDAFRGNRDEHGFVLDANTGSAPLRDLMDDVADDRTRSRMLEDWTVVDGGLRGFDFTSEKVGPVDAAERAALTAAMPGYGATLSGGLDFDSDYFRILDVARRLGAGTGSLGVTRYYLLVEGSSDDIDDDVILDVKQQVGPTPLSFLPAEQPSYESAFADHAHRHAVAMKALSLDTDDHLGWLRAMGIDFSVRERSPAKDDLDVSQLSAAELEDIAADWGAALAAAHARSDRDFDPAFIDVSVDAAIDNLTEGEHAEVRALVRDVASSYADQVNADFIAFVQALAGHCESP